MYLADALSREVAGHRIAAQRHEYPRVDEGYLPFEVGRTGRYLFRFRIPVARGAALDHIGDVDAVAVQACDAEKLVEKVPCRTDERAALLIFIEARPLADEPHFGVRVALARHGFSAGLRQAA